MKAQLEHINVTVKDPHRTARLLIDIFDWEQRWEGPSQSGGHSVHVGSATSYLALYAPPREVGQRHQPGHVGGGLNHIALVVDDLDEAERRIRAAGFQTLNHADYHPGKRFYFYDQDEIEYEVVSYVGAMGEIEGACLTK